MDEARPRHTRPRFYDLCMRYQFDAQRLQEIGDQAGVSHSIVNSLFLGDPVGRSDAQKVLVILSEQTRETWNLDNTNVPLIPDENEPHRERDHLFFPDLWRIHRFRTDLMAPLAQVSEEVIHAMMRSEPVTSAEAKSVLAALSRALKQEYTLENVFVSLLEEGGKNAADK